MAYQRIKTDKETGICQYLCEETTDLNKILITEDSFGDIAYVLEDKKFYIVNSSGEWEEQ